MVTLEGLEGQLLLGLDLLLTHLLDLTSKDNVGRGRTVDTVGLDGDNGTTAILQEHVGVETNDTGLVGLGNVGKDDIDHGHEHAVAERVTGILNDGDNVGAVSGHANQVTTRAVRELDGVDVTGRADNISDVRDGGTAGSTEVENLGTGLHVDVVHTTQDTGSQLGTEGVPHTVLDLGDGAVLSGGGLDRDTLLAVHGLAGGQVLGDKQILLTTTGNEDTGVTVGLLCRKSKVSDWIPSYCRHLETYDDNLSTTTGTGSTAAATARSTTASTGTTTATTTAAAAAITTATTTTTTEATFREKKTRSATEDLQALTDNSSGSHIASIFTSSGHPSRLLRFRKDWSTNLDHLRGHRGHHHRIHHVHHVQGDHHGL